MSPGAVACGAGGGVALGVVSVRSGGRAAITMHGHHTHAVLLQVPCLHSRPPVWRLPAAAAAASTLAAVAVRCSSLNALRASGLPREPLRV